MLKKDFYKSGKSKLNYNIILVGITLLLLAMFTLGCNKSPKGSFYTLQEAYDNGFIDLEDLKSITHFQNNGKEWYYEEEGKLLFKDWDYVPRNKNPNELSEETIIDIKNTEVYFLRKSGTSKAKVKDITITYLGTYHNCIAVSVENAWIKSPAVIYATTIEEQVILYGHQIKIWISLKDTEA